MKTRVIGALCIGVLINVTSGYGQVARKDPAQSARRSPDHASPRGMIRLENVRAGSQKRRV